MLARVLEERGFDVLTTGSGREAIELYTRCKCVIGLIVSDVQMSGMSGPELIAELAKAGCRLPVLYLSGFETPDFWPPMGVPVELLRKPFSPGTLVRKVRALMVA
jgi:two-component system response regulator DctR/two-component system response regulator FixJ